MTGPGPRPRIAVPKGRVLDDLRPIIPRAGYPLPDPGAGDRRLRFDEPERPLEVVLLRGKDVPTWVASGAADLGVAGLDVLMEHPQPVYSPLDLGTGLCWMCVIGTPAQAEATTDPARPLRVATKFPRIAAEYFAGRGRQIEPLTMAGNIELAALSGAADAVVDLVQTGGTLRRNGLVAHERFLRVTTRLICNRAAWHLRQTAIDQVVRGLRAARDEIAPPGAATDNEAPA